MHLHSRFWLRQRGTGCAPRPRSAPLRTASARSGPRGLGRRRSSRTGRREPARPAAAAGPLLPPARHLRSCPARSRQLLGQTPSSHPPLSTALELRGPDFYKCRGTNALLINAGQTECVDGSAHGGSKIAPEPMPAARALPKPRFLAVEAGEGEMSGHWAGLPLSSRPGFLPAAPRPQRTHSPQRVRECASDTLYAGESSPRLCVGSRSCSQKC